MTRQKLVNPKNKVIQITVTEKIYNQFSEKADQLGTTRSDLGRQIIEVYLE